MTRPPLTPSIAVNDFQDYYWLKEELVTFCRQVGISTAGGKQAISERIVAFLNHAPVPEPVPAGRGKKSKAAEIPQSLTPETVIGPGWRCNEALRAFFTSQIGPQFHFNGAMRDFIYNGQGKTLAEAVAAWHESQAADRAETEIAPQFEYNRHMREFFKAYPDQDRSAAIAAWNAKKAKRKENE